MQNWVIRCISTHAYQFLCLARVSTRPPIRERSKHPSSKSPSDESYESHAAKRKTCSAFQIVFSRAAPQKSAISLRSLKSQNEVKTLLSTSLSCYLPVMHPINLFYPWCGEGQLSDLLIYCNSAIARSSGPRVVTPTIARLGIAITLDPRVVESGRSNGSFALVLLTHFGGTFLHFGKD